MQFLARGVTVTNKFFLCEIGFASYQQYLGGMLQTKKKKGGWGGGGIAEEREIYY